MESAESDVGYFEIDAALVEPLEEIVWTGLASKA